MSKRKKKGNKVPKPESAVNLVTAVINLLIALILLFEKLKS